MAVEFQEGPDVHSWEALRNATERVGVKAVAAKLKVSTALVYKWCQEPQLPDAGGSGARNPLDRLRVLYELTGDAGIVRWLCAAASGFFVANPPTEADNRDEQLLGNTQQLVQDFAQLLEDISQSIENDGQITRPEADKIRDAWDALKGHAERFVVTCERGVYGSQKT